MTTMGFLFFIFSLFFSCPGNNDCSPYYPYRRLFSQSNFDRMSFKSFFFIERKEKSYLLLRRLLLLFLDQPNVPSTPSTPTRSHLFTGRTMNLHHEVSYYEKSRSGHHSVTSLPDGYT